MLRAALALTLSCASPVLAQEFSLITPIACDLTQTCYIQQYMDQDPGPEVRDYQCNTLANNGHSGTDFALPSMAMMEVGIDVLAAAPGIVKGTRDGIPDTGLTAQTADSITGRECGNGVRIDHADGWTTQYCHLKQGSILVRSGQSVQAGARLGQVGKSGSATFPHLHFSLRRNGTRVDPFDPNMSESCTTTQTDSLWQESLPYRRGGLITVGLFDRIPEYQEVKEGNLQLAQLTPDMPILALWSYSFATQKNDVLRLTLSGPNGIILTKDIDMPKPQALAMRAIGQRKGFRKWPTGTYTGTVTLLRGGVALETRRTTLSMP